VDRLDTTYKHPSSNSKTAGPSNQIRVNTHIQAEMNQSEGRRRIMGGDLNAATSRTGYSISTKSHFEKVDNQFENFIQRRGGSLIQS